MNEPARCRGQAGPAARRRMRRAASAAAFLLVILAPLFSAFLAAPATAAVITYNGSSTHSLQQLVDSAGAGGTILIASGTYPGNLVINRSVTLAALDPASPPVLVAGQGNAVIELAANGVVLDGLSLEGNTTYGLLVRSDNNKVYNTSITGFSYGIGLESAVHNEFFRNTLVGNAVGLSADHDSQADTFSLNSFDNAIDVSSRSDELSWSGDPSGYQYTGRNFTGMLGNFWKKYTGTDADNNGIGDTPWPVEAGQATGAVAGPAPAGQATNESAFLDRSPLVASPAAYTVTDFFQPGSGPFPVQPGGGLPQVQPGQNPLIPSGPGTGAGTLPSGPGAGTGPRAGLPLGLIMDYWWLVPVIVVVSAGGGIWFERSRKRRVAPVSADSTPSPARNATVVRKPQPAGPENRDTGHYAARLPPALEKRYPGAEYVAEGGASRVFRAHDAEEGRDVAVKVPIRFDEVTGTQFTKELQVWQGLHHKNIVGIYAANIFPVPYIEMEYVESSLGTTKFPLPVGRAVAIVRGVAEGLRYAHGLGIVHRDIKPGNILIAPDGTPKITDWGLAKAEGTKRSGLIGFSLEYASPEQLAPNLFGEPGPWTDIYQLGVLFYEMLAGHVPFRGGGMGEVTHAILHDEPPALAPGGPDAERIRRIIKKCMEKDPKDRYRSVAEILQDLEGIGDG